MPTPAEINALPVYTPTQHLKMWELASIELAAAGVSYAINGRTLTRNNASMVQDMITYWSQQVVALQAGAAGGGNILVRFGDPA